VALTPGISQNRCSLPQKQPLPNVTLFSPSANGSLIGVPFTKCLFVMRISFARPGRHSSLLGMLWLPPIISVRTRGTVAGCERRWEFRTVRRRVLLSIQ